MEKQKIDEDELNDEYHLKRLPTAEEHACAQDWTEIRSKEKVYNNKNDGEC